MNWYVAFQIDITDPANPKEMDRVIRAASHKADHERMKDLLDGKVCGAYFIWVYLEWEE